MSVELSLKTIEEQLYLGHAKGPCSYLANRESSLLFLQGFPLGETYRLLLDKGYRRHGFDVYRPDCSSCQECQVLRVPLTTWLASRSQKRVWKKCQNVFEVQIVSPSNSKEKQELYNSYLIEQHKKDEPITDDASYEAFFVDSFLLENTYELQLWYQGRLAGVGIFDVVMDAISAVYFYFDVEVASYSPGTYNILFLIEHAKSLGLEYLYPGYYISDCPAMSYKNNFVPNQTRRVGDVKWQ